VAFSLAEGLFSRVCCPALSSLPFVPPPRLFGFQSGFVLPSRLVALSALTCCAKACSLPKILPPKTSSTHFSACPLHDLYLAPHYRTCCEFPQNKFLDPAILPASIVADLYRRRWRIEEAFQTVKRLLNLSYLWTGSLNGILLQIWATWLFFALLVDLGDEVANELMLPFDRISLEMVFRGLYYFTQAHQRGEATDPVKYLAAPENRDLGVIKRIRKKSLLASDTTQITSNLSPA
jgi:hypothetical protein